MPAKVIDKRCVDEKRETATLETAIASCDRYETLVPTCPQPNSQAVPAMQVLREKLAEKLCRPSYSDGSYGTNGSTKESTVARRRRESGLDLIAGIPWPIGIALGIVACLAIRFWLPWYFNQSGSDIGKALGHGLAKGPIPLFSWIALGLCWVGAGLSYFKQQQRAQLFDTQAKNLQLSALDWRQFELLVGEWFRRQGYQVEENGGGGPDGGIDLTLRKAGRTELVQCKQWRRRQVTVATAREMWGLAQHHGADAVWIVCAGEFSPDAAAFAAGKPVHLVTGKQLGELIQEKPIVTAVTEAPVQVGTLPACPKCGGPMLERRNRQTGDNFLGCQAYPNCRGTLTLG